MMKDKSSQGQSHFSRSFWFHILDVIFNIAIIVAIVGGIRTFVISPFQIDGQSMLDTLENSEYIIINKFRYFLGTPQRGDIVVFVPPIDASKYYVKRVIGIPGDTVVLKNGFVYLRRNGSDIQLDEPYLSPANRGRTYAYPIGSGDTDEHIFVVPQDQYFVLGDNRQASFDSRSFGHPGSGNTAFVPRYNIKGSFWFVALPITKIHAFEPPNYQL